MKTHYISCAISSAVDRKTNRLSLFHVLEEIVAPAFPFTLASFDMAVLFEREPDDQRIESYVVTIDLDGSLLASFNIKVDFAKARRNRSVNTINRLAIPTAGLMTISVRHRSIVLASWTLVARLDGVAAPTRQIPSSEGSETPSAADRARPN